MDHLPNKSVHKVPPPEQWEAMKQYIHQLYVQEGETLQALMKKMKKDHDFKAS